MEQVEQERREEILALLWAEFFKTRSNETRNDLVIQYVHLVKCIVARLMPSYRKHVEFDDLMSSGMIGLMDAIDKYDPDKEVKFETYASLRVKGEIIDQIRRQDWAPTSLRQKIKKIENGFEKLESNLGRTASEREVAQYLSMDEDDVKRTLDDSHAFNIMALDEVIVDRIGGGEPASAHGLPEESFEQKELTEILAKQITALPEREQLVISLYYQQEMTLKEIGLTLGVTESRVSQIHSKAMMHLRAKMQQVLC